jgi:multiple sugar transport system permease protein
MEGKRVMPIGRGSLHKLMQRKSTIAFLMTLPLFTLIIALVAYPAGYAIYLCTWRR